MGCDIHLVVEKETKVGWVGVHTCPWLGDGAIEVIVFDKSKAELLRPAPTSASLLWHVKQRNYDLFALLANVRGDGPAPRGFPVDASLLARIESESWGRDGHSHSYCSVVEFARCYVKTLSAEEQLAFVKKKLKGNEAELEALACNLFAIEDPEKHRVVFWFDN